MRKIYTLLLALVVSMTAFAQSPDPSKWEVGDNVIADLGMGDYDPHQKWSVKPKSSASSKDPGDYGTYWKGKGQLLFSDYYDEFGDLLSADASQIQTGLGFYGDGSIAKEAELVNIYQVVTLPAGWYTIRVQSCFRDVGGQAGAPYGSWKEYLENWTPYAKYAWAYVDAYASKADAEDDAKKPVQTFTTAVRHIGDSEQETALATGLTDGNWRDDATYTVTMQEYDDFLEEVVDKEYTYAYPRSMVGATYYFKAGKYWNEFDVLLEKETTVRIGLRKTLNNAEDWLTMGEWQIIYNGNPTTDEQVKEDYAEKSFDGEVEELELMQRKLTTKAFDGFNESYNTAFADYLDDVRMTAQTEYDDAEDMQERQDAIDKLKAINLQSDADYEAYGNLSFLLTKSKYLLSKTDLPGKSTFQSTYNDILKKINGYSIFDEENTPGKVTEEFFNQLVDARGAYLDTQVADEDGAKDFSAVINYPWFVKDDFAPTQNDDGTWSIKEESWADAGGSGTYNDKKSGRTDIAAGVKIVENSTTVKNQWFVDVDMDGKTNETRLDYVEGGLIAAHDYWHAGNFNSGSKKLCQNVLGLPKGYYSLKALIRRSGGGTGDYHNIYMQNLQGEVKASPVVASQDQDTWQEVSTGIIYVKEEDRELLIGGQSDQTALFTGFRLLFYGTEPPIENLIKQEIAEIQESELKLTAEDGSYVEFEGDKAYIKEQIDKCDMSKLTIETFEEYRGYLNDARIRITDALKAYKKFTAKQTYADIETESVVADVAELIKPAKDAATNLGKSTDDTYKDIDGVNELADKYADYLKVRAEATAFQDASINTTLADQKAALVAAPSTVKTLNKYIASLSTPMSINEMKALGAENATKTAPVDITSLLKNPTFESKSAWLGTPYSVYGDASAEDWIPSGISTQHSSYSRGNMEIWQSGPGTLSQTLSGMPAGTYRVTCYAIYRDGDVVNADMVKAWDATEGDIEKWEPRNALLYAKTSDENKQITYVRGVESLRSTERSYTDIVRGYEGVPGEDDEPYAVSVQVLNAEDKDAMSEKYPSATTVLAPGDDDYQTWAFETEVDVDGTTYYFPASMYAFWLWCEKEDKTPVLHSVEITIESGENLEIGVEKTAQLTGDWLIFDEFKLEYLSGDTFKEVLTGIEDVTPAETTKTGVRYNTAGQIVDEFYKGVVIIDGVKVIQ